MLPNIFWNAYHMLYVFKVINILSDNSANPLARVSVYCFECL